jgi:hypothetical protein
MTTGPKGAPCDENLSKTKMFLATGIPVYIFDGNPTVRK